MKNQSFFRRLGFAVAGFAGAFRSENSFKLHVVAALAVLIALAWLRPEPLWWAVIVLTITLVLAAELFNTAVEHLADRVQPEQDPRIKAVKDCAAAAVLVASLGALGVAVALIFELLFA